MRVCGTSCETGEVLTLEIAEGRICAIESGVSEPELGGAAVWLAPGFHDLQVNGYGGYDFNCGGSWTERPTAEEDLPALFSLLARSGTALLCPTIVTDSAEAMQTALARLNRFLEANPPFNRMVTGVHLEGPYLSSEEGPVGAHPPHHTRDPDWAEFQRFQEASSGRIKLCTLAPERPGALPFITRLAESGVTVALGHTGAAPETIREAVRAGATLSTHLGNGAHNLIRRHPNYIWEQLAHDELYASVIADGFHLPAAVVKCFARAKGAERLALISDSVALGGLPPGVYANGRFEVLPSGKVTLAGTPYLAGAGHLLDACLANALRFTDLSLAQVVRSVTAIPARILGLERRKGHLRVGGDADITLFRLGLEGTLEIVATLCGGELLYSAP